MRAFERGALLSASPATVLQHVEGVRVAVVACSRGTGARRAPSGVGVPAAPRITHDDSL